ncbi:MAG: choice-of-anchor L domain-containing protein [Bacteroidota bacterium]|nr:choice-of-anchor L domain-containing protein [Bacteroidota bacterium]
MKRILLPLFSCALLTTTTLTAQNINDFKTYKTQKTGELDAQHLFETLIGEGVVLKSFSITKTPSDEAYGFFEDKKSSFGMKKGMIMTTGGIAALCSGNTTQAMSNMTHANVENRNHYSSKGTECLELQKLINPGQKTFDVCFIEMDVVPTADTLSFNYVFGSEEYDEFVGSEYNDVFGFFITGKGIDGEKNLAVVPNSKSPVSVNSINNGKHEYGSRIMAANPSYYVSNVNGALPIEYDGLTKLMEIRQAVTPYETYHIKMAIADVSDDSYDSGVLIEGQSFVSYERSYNVQFDKNTSDITNGYKALLDNLVKLYKKNPEGKILITGHTDSEGDLETNEKLSCERATAIINYIKNKGISADRMIMNCKGETQPRYSNATDVGKALNRRVEIRIGGGLEEYEKKKVEAETEIKVEETKLLSNFPNPFSESTTIEAYLQKDVKSAQVVISDMEGKILKTIYLLERGKTSTYLDGQNLTNGTYIATLVIDNKVSGSIKLLVAH